MDLLERARALAACPLFESLAPAVLVRLGERARAVELATDETLRTDDTVWVVAAGAVTAGATRAGVGAALGVIRVVRPATPALELVAAEPSIVIALAADDVRDVLEEDPLALAALADRLATSLLGAA